LLSGRLQDSVAPRRIAALAAAIGLQLLCGHPQIAWVSWLGIAAFTIGRAAPPPARSTLAALALALSLVLGVAVAGAAFLPFLELIGQGNRPAPTLAFASGGAMEWWHWTSLFITDGGRRVFYWEHDQYVGALAAVGGIAGLLRLRDRNTRGLALVAVVGLLVASGPRTPAFALLFRLLPGLASFHIHSRAAILVALAMALGAAGLLSQAAPGWRAGASVAGGAAVAIAVTAAAVGWLPRPPLGPVPSATAPLRVVVLLLVGALASAVLLGRGRRRDIARAGLLAVLCLDLLAARSASKRAWGLPPPPVATERTVRRTLLEAGLLVGEGVPPRVFLPPFVARENAALMHGWSSVTGYNALTLDRVWIYLHRALGLVPSLDENTYVHAGAYAHGPFPYPVAAISLGWDPRQLGLNVRGDADARGYLAGAAVRVGDWRAAVDRMAAGHDVHHVALVEDDGLAALPAVPVDDDPGRVQITSYRPERIVLRVDARRPALLVVKEAWYPGWTAAVDGSASACRPVNGWMRGVVVPAGPHEVTLRYRSRFLGAGVLLSSAAVLLVAWIAKARTSPGP
jgi:hypothetical protein